MGQGQGSQGSVNLGIVGVDWGPDGAGATLGGFRVGHSEEQGIEMGVNPGIGVSIDGQGAYAGARATVGIRADGMSYAAGAKAVWANESAGACAVAATDALPVAITGTRSLERDARADEESCKKFLQDKKEALSEAWSAVDEAIRSRDEQQRLLDECQQAVEARQRQKKAAGAALTQAQDMRKETKMSMIPIEEKLRELSDDLDFADSGDEQEATALRLSQTQTKEAIDSLQRRVEEKEAESSRLETELLEKNELWRVAREGLEEKQLVLKQKRKHAAVCQAHLDKAASAHETAEGKHRAAKRKLEHEEESNRKIHKHC
eukprot:TRINITY_DN13424_c0_g5_i1.p1 TRINITY_DN13424_c0_g5~~TRINITY_DN13424_c0_g5_i1.p1  ORF type:complete len:319 (-),score=68.92 TRINITY_DN13424_c0_g5_i1:92-1048(-)